MTDKRILIPILFCILVGMSFIVVAQQEKVGANILDCTGLTESQCKASTIGVPSLEPVIREGGGEYYPTILIILNESTPTEELMRAKERVEQDLQYAADIAFDFKDNIEHEQGTRQLFGESFELFPDYNEVISELQVKIDFFDNLKAQVSNQNTGSELRDLRASARNEWFETLLLERYALLRIQPARVILSTGYSIDEILVENVQYLSDHFRLYPVWIEFKRRAVDDTHIYSSDKSGFVQSWTVSRDGWLAVWENPPMKTSTEEYVPVGWGAFYNMDSSVANHIAVDDIDGDGVKEVIVYTMGRLAGAGVSFGSDPARVYVFNYVNGDLVVKSGWPYLFGTNAGFSALSSPAIGVIDSSLEKKIVMPFNNNLYVFDSSGNIVSGWPQQTVTSEQGPVLADIDADGINEIIFPSRGNITVWDGNGQLLNSFVLESGGARLLTPAVEDLDNDGVPEIVAVSDRGFNSSVYVTDSNGNSLSGWPKDIGRTIAQPTIADVNNDGEREILVVLRDERKVQIYDRDGNLLEEKVGSQDGIFIGSAVVAQLDSSSSSPQIIIGDRRNNLHVFNSPLTHWPKNVASSGGFHTSSAVVADINGDGDLDIIIGSDGTPPFDIDKNLYAFSYSTGQLISGYPKASNAAFRSSPIVADLDNDGNVEVVIGSEDGYLYLADGVGSGPIVWSQNGGSPERRNAI